MHACKREMQQVFKKFNFERAILFLLGLSFFGFSLSKIYTDQIGQAGGAAAIAIMCLILSNLARFKRFKGFGIEAELWEDKQEEAAALIDYIKTFTREIVTNSVMAGRWDSSQQWAARWKLFHDLTEKKPIKGVDFDFADLREEVENVFLYDICIKIAPHIQERLEAARGEAAAIIAAEFPAPITDVEGYKARVLQNDVVVYLDKAFQIAKIDNLATRMLEMAETSGKALNDAFGVTVEFDTEQMARLRKIANLWDKRPMKISSELIGWADYRP